MAKDNEFEDFDQTFSRFRRTDGLPFSELLSVERVEQALATLGVKFRERVFTPVATLWVFLSQVLSADHSCRDAVARLLAWRVAQGRPPCSANTASYCLARQRLPVELAKQLVRETGRELEQKAVPAWLWKGLHVKLVDGTTRTMPDTPENQAAYPRRRNQAHGVGFPIVRAVAILSLGCAALLDAAIGPMRGKKSGENSLFRGLQDCLEAKDVLLVDRLFCSFQDLATLRAQKVDVVVRQHASRRTDFRRGKWLGTLDHIVVWKRPKFSHQRFDVATWESLPEQMEVRELRFRVTQPGFRPGEITLATTFLDPLEQTAEELSELYRARWNMAEAARHAQVLPRNLSFKGAVQTVNSFATYLALKGADRDRLWSEMLTAIATHEVGNRPDRYEPRKLKYRPGKFPYLTQSRSIEKQRLCG